MPRVYHDKPAAPSSRGHSPPWAVGGYEWDGATSQVFHGWVGDVRIVNRPLSVREFMMAR
jgi:hypothetical protein